ncbi:hypothetical protein [Dactylosporangium sp. CA-152071]|uniref:hypothetical protein n=1 Tax=Dactylosporangium sp. CA-152071 TaxID=3239933 RepID=UPI003D94B0EC
MNGFAWDEWKAEVDTSAPDYQDGRCRAGGGSRDGSVGAYCDGIRSASSSCCGAGVSARAMTPCRGKRLALWHVPSLVVVASATPTRLRKSLYVIVALAVVVCGGHLQIAGAS